MITVEWLSIYFILEQIYDNLLKQFALLFSNVGFQLLLLI